MAMTEDLDVFLDTGDFALAATLQGGTTVNGIFDKAYAEAFDVGGTNPAFVCDSSDVAIGDLGKTLTVSGTVYVIKAREPIDDGAFVRLQLQAQS